jgi:RNA polymerase sigma-70 factor (ECF subfamily)
VADSDAALLDALRSGDEAAFVALVRRYHSRLLRFAETLVPTRAVAEEVVQDTWLGVVKGIHRFEGRSSVRTWLFRVLVNRARSAGAREQRNIPLDRDDSLWGRFGADGHWRDEPDSWSERVDAQIAAGQLAERVRACLSELPAAQRQVMVLRDVEGLDASEACELLGLSAANQRVLLHRARTRVRSILEVEMSTV